MALPLPGGPDDDPDRQQKFDALARAMAGFGGKSVEIRYGTATLTFTASTDSAAVSVTHGLGRLPVSVVAMSFGSSFGRVANCNWASPTATTFLFAGEVKTAFTGTVTVTWIAIG